MHRTNIVFLTAVILLLGVTTFAPPASAARGNGADPYRISACLDIGGDLELCVTAKGVSKEHETPSGNTQRHQTRHSCYTITITTTGEVIEERCIKDNFVLHQKDGEDHVYHGTVKQAFAFTHQGTWYECMYSYNVTYANGEFRHEHAQET